MTQSVVCGFCHCHRAYNEKEAGSCRKDISMYNYSSNLSPLGASTELISCATELRSEYVGVTVFGTLLA